MRFIDWAPARFRTQQRNALAGSDGISYRVASSVEGNGDVERAGRQLAASGTWPNIPATGEAGVLGAG
jgi:hypothetical protein